MTNNDIRALNIINKASCGGELVTLYSDLGFLLYPEASKHRWPQGMVLAASKVVNRLISQGVLEKFPGRFGTNEHVLKITKLGNKLLTDEQHPRV